MRRNSISYSCKSVHDSRSSISRLQNIWSGYRESWPVTQLVLAISRPYGTTTHIVWPTCLNNRTMLWPAPSPKWQKDLRSNSTCCCLTDPVRYIHWASSQHSKWRVTRMEFTMVQLCGYSNFYKKASQSRPQFQNLIYELTSILSWRKGDDALSCGQLVSQHLRNWRYICQGRCRHDWIQADAWLQSRRLLTVAGDRGATWQPCICRAQTERQFYCGPKLKNLPDYEKLLCFEHGNISSRAHWKCTAIGKSWFRKLAIRKFET